MIKKLIILLIILLIPAVGFSLNTEMFIKGKGGSLGFKPGIGGSISFSEKIHKYVDAELSGQLILNHKIPHEQGYSYGYGGKLIFGHNFTILFKPYVHIGYRISGYHSEGNEQVWEKEGDKLVGGLGINYYPYDIRFTYYFKENDTINEVNGWSIRAKRYLVEVNEHIILLFKSTEANFTQGGERMSGGVFELGVGYQF